MGSVVLCRFVGLLRQIVQVNSVALGLVAAISSGCSGKKPADNVADLPTCIAFGGFEENVCPAPLVRLISTPERYAKRIVLTRGFVRFGPDAWRLYVNRESAAAHDYSSSCRLVGANKAGLQDQTYVDVIGYFEPRYDEENVLSEQCSIIRVVKRGNETR